jgi:hypothetical protein
VAWLSAMDEASPWAPYNEPALLLAAVCAPVVVLRLTRAQRLFGLATVTVLGAWIALTHVQALLIGSFPVDARATVVALLSVFCSLFGCYLAQLGAGSASPVGSPAVGDLRRPHE